jgi:hypothetical protein
MTNPAQLERMNRLLTASAMIPSGMTALKDALWREIEDAARKADAPLPNRNHDPR